MSSWFKKVFAAGAAKPAPAAPIAEPEAQQARPVASPPTIDNPALGKPDVEDTDAQPKMRAIVNAPVIAPEEEQSSWSDEIKIKARVESDGLTCTFLVDRPLLEDLSAWFPAAVWAENVSPLAEALFAVEGVGNVLLHDTTLTIGLADGNTRPWEDLAAEVGAVARAQLKSDASVIVDDFRDAIPPEEDIRQRVQTCLDLEINPGIAAHSGVITLERVSGNTVYISMGGGCQGCAASTITLRQGVHQAFRRAVPELGAIFDQTDHTTGTNPYYKELPAEMR